MAYAPKGLAFDSPDAQDESRDSFPKDLSSPGSATSKADAATKKARRVTMYPNSNSTNKIEKPFSRSAAKRDSVMALGSIEHLQHYFTKAGLSASKAPMSGKGPFVPALGPGIPSLAVKTNIPTLVFDLPPSPIPPIPSSPGPTQTVVEPSPYIADPEALKKGVIRDLEAVESAWRLGSHSSNGSSTPPPPHHLSPPHSSQPQSQPSIPTEFDVLHVLKITTHAIRSVRNYLLALPEDHPTLHFGANLIEAFKHHSISRPAFGKSRITSTSGTPRPATSSPIPPTAPITSNPAPVTNSNITAPDPPSVIRRAALDVLSALRVLEENSRLPLTDEAYDSTKNPSRLLRTQSPVSFALDREGSNGGSVLSREDSSDGAGSATMVASPSTQGQVPPRSPKPEIIPLKVNGREKAIEVWADHEEEEWEDFDEDAAEKQDPWDERLVLGGGWLYRNDIDFTSLEKEQSAVKRYLDVVDEVVFTNSLPASPGQRGWQRAKLSMTASKPKSKSRSSLGLNISDGSPRKSGSTSLSRPLVSPVLLDAMNDASRFTDEPSSIDAVLEQDEFGDDGNHSPQELPDDALPGWARRSQFSCDQIGRLQAFISSHLPPELVSFLPSPSTSNSSDVFTLSSLTPSSDTEAFRESLLVALSDGQLLCTAYNAAVRKSRNPWGYVKLENVHDLLNLTHKEDKEELELDLSLGGRNTKSKSSWTFRRTENLRYWAAALKLRYMIPFITPRALDPSKHNLTEQKSTSTLSRAFSDPLVTPPVVFEPKVVAAREEGWEDMFEKVLMRWLDVVTAEKRMKS